MLIESVAQTRVSSARRYCDIFADVWMKFINQRLQKTLSSSFGISANCHNVSIGRFSRTLAGRLSIIFIEEDIVLREDDNHSNLHCGIRQVEQIERMFKSGLHN